MPTEKVFHASLIICPACGRPFTHEPMGGCVQPEFCDCGEELTDSMLQRGWWTLHPEESDPHGPFATEAAALASIA